MEANSHIARSSRTTPALELICGPARFLSSAVLSLESSTPQSEYTMNIFYIIGVIVVVLFVAGFFGLHV
jgi:hypothetical protein